MFYHSLNIRQTAVDLLRTLGMPHVSECIPLRHSLAPTSWPRSFESKSCELIAYNLVHITNEVSIWKIGLNSKIFQNKNKNPSGIAMGPMHNTDIIVSDYVFSNLPFTHVSCLLFPFQRISFRVTQTNDITNLVTMYQHVEDEA